MNKSDVYDYVTERIIARLEQGEVPWINTRTKPLLLARSATTGKVYRADRRNGILEIDGPVKTKNDHPRWMEVDR